MTPLASALATDHGPDELRDSRSFDVIEGLEDVDDLGDDQVGHEKLVGGSEERACSARLARRIAGQMSDQDVRVYDV